SVYGQPGEDDRRTDDPVPVEAALLRRLWQRLGNMASEDQRDLVRGIRCGSPVLFDFLSAKIIPESRKDRQRGIEVAELALDSLNASNAAIGEDLLPNLQALGEARLGNALRLALRWDEAERAFGRAEKHWESAGESSEPRVSAEIWRLEASLRQNQRRFSEALALTDRAIALTRLASDRHSEMRALVQRATVLVYTGDPKAALLPLREAEELVGGHDPGDLQLLVYQTLGTASVLADETQESDQALARAKKLCEATGNKVVWYQIMWVEGLLRQSQDRIQEAEALFQEALTKFIALGERDLAAMLSLELAILHLRQGHTSEAIRLASATIPVFQSLRIHREALAALNLLREAITANELTLDGL
ncbi:MAG: hypothetical protein GY835_16380, partial [bacterium]|nr:hypothetical protein [bacterium]